MWNLLQFDEGGRFLASMARRARKYRLCLRIISQDVEDCLNSEWGRTILVNSAMKFPMKQDATTIDAVTSAFHLSEDERRYLLTCPKGAGLFFARSAHVPLRVIASPLEFQLATTGHSGEEETQEQGEKHQAMALRTEEENHYQVVLPSYWTPGASHNGHNGN